MDNYCTDLSMSKKLQRIDFDADTPFGWYRLYETDKIWSLMTHNEARLYEQSRVYLMRMTIEKITNAYTADHLCWYITQNGGSVDLLYKQGDLNLKVILYVDGQKFIKLFKGDHAANLIARAIIWAHRNKYLAF